MSRVYLDWNATAPLRPEARAAMLEAMDVVGNPSSVHAEGRAAKAVIEKARGQVARLVGCEPSEIVFTSGATEAAALARTSIPVVETQMMPEDPNMVMLETEHDAVGERWTGTTYIPVHENGVLDFHGERCAANGVFDWMFSGQIFAVQSANSETGVLQDLVTFVEDFRSFDSDESLILVDAVQSLGKTLFSLSAIGADMALSSAHKLGGPKGVGSLSVKPTSQQTAMLTGGGQEMGRRSGTENVIGIAGFGAAAEATLRDLEDGVWERVEKLRNILEDALAAVAKEIIFVGKEVDRLPNTSCFITPGWRGETQVMQMDLAGYAISAGSACSSGKVKESRVLRAMGFDAVAASSAVRVSLGPTTTEDEVLGFVGAWTEAHRRWKARAA